MKSNQRFSIIRIKTGKEFKWNWKKGKKQADLEGVEQLVGVLGRVIKGMEVREGLGWLELENEEIIKNKEP